MIDVFCRGFFMVYMEYKFNIFNRSVVSVAWEITQMKSDVIWNYIEFFTMGLWSIDFLRAVVYK